LKVAVEIQTRLKRLVQGHQTESLRQAEQPDAVSMQLAEIYRVPVFAEKPPPEIHLEFMRLDLEADQGYSLMAARQGRGCL
jgi:hypothetical protein